MSYPQNPISASFVEQYRDKTPPWGFDGLGYVVYKRTYARPILDENENIVATEEWWQTVQRVINGAQAIGAKYTVAEAERLYDYMFNLKGSPSGRILWQLGTSNNERLGGDSLSSCWFTEVGSVKDFCWIFERLMLGGGVGFAVDQPQRLGVVRQGSVQVQDNASADFIIPDTREGWAGVLLRVLQTYLGGVDDPDSLTYSTQLVRPEGAPIKSFGGTASGPQILVTGLENICAVLDKAISRTLTSIEVLDIVNIIGQIVVSGNVRRSAEIALGSPFDLDFLQAKRWDLIDIPSWRALSNNSVYLTPEQIPTLPDEFWAGYLGTGEAYGMFNLAASQVYGRMGESSPDWTIAGINPCGEVPIAHHESCNLAELFLPNIGSQAELADLAKLLYKMQKAVAGMTYLDHTSNMITARNRRLGLGVTGVAQAIDKLDWLDATYRELHDFDLQWSADNDIPVSVRLTTVKPSGTLSLLAGVTPGIHPGYAQHHIRRVRMAHNDPLVEYCSSRGYAIENLRNFDGSENPLTVVVEFPCRFPDGTMLAKDTSAIAQLDLQKRLQKEWADNAVSVSVYYTPDELPMIKDYLIEHWAEMKSVSFLLHANHGYDQAPLEEIDSQRFWAIQSSLTEYRGAITGVSELLDGEGCATGQCPIR